MQKRQHWSSKQESLSIITLVKRTIFHWDQQPVIQYSECSSDSSTKVVKYPKMAGNDTVRHLADFVFASMMRKSLHIVHRQLFHGFCVLSIDCRRFSAHQSRRDMQGLRICIRLQVNSRTNRLKGAERILMTTRNFDAVLLRELQPHATRTVLQDCSIEPMLLVHLFCVNGLVPADFHNLATKITNRHESYPHTVGIRGLTDIRGKCPEMPFPDLA
jgi:hypothetical protein